MPVIEPVRDQRSAMATAAPFAAAGVALLAGLAWASDDPAGRSSAWAALLLTLIVDGALVGAWFIAAAGLGRVVHAATLGPTHKCPASQVALGAGAMIVLAWALGWAGWLNGFTAWGLVVVGLALAAAGLIKHRDMKPTASWALWLAGPAVGLLFAAAAVAPGALWRVPMPTDAGGAKHVLIAYDVLSYHLQLPREWFNAGRITGYEHNVYSYLPGGLEAAFTQLMHMRGDPLAAATACQLLHAAFALLAAACIAQLVIALAARAQVRHRLARLAGASAAAVYLAVPWTIVTGSMAFTEQATNALGAAALLIAMHPGQPRPLGRGVAAGWLVGGAAMCKLTAIGMFGVPVAFVLIWGAHHGRRRALLGYLVGGAIPMGLFMLRNWMWTANPVFPMATGLLGTAHWTNQQAGRWQDAHSPLLDFATRGRRLVTMMIAHSHYGLVVWPAAAAGAAIVIALRGTRRVGVMLLIFALLAVAFWLSVTHLQSRFVTAVLVPACVLIGLGLARLRFAPAALLIAAGLVGVLCWHSAQAYRGQWRGGAAGLIGQTRQMATLLPPWGPINALTGEPRIYAEGFAAAFYVQPTITYHTVWDASPLGALIDEHGAAGAIDRLREAGYTHLLIDYQMLNLWWSNDNYGYDPRFGPAQLRAIEALRLPVVFVDPPPIYVLYDLTGRPGN